MPDRIEEIHARVSRHHLTHRLPWEPSEIAAEVSLSELQRRARGCLGERAPYYRWAVLDADRRLRRQHRPLPRMLGASITAPDQERKAVAADVCRQLQQQLNLLPERYYSVVKLRYVQGLTEREVARRLGLSPATIHRCCARIRKLALTLSRAI